METSSEYSVSAEYLRVVRRTVCNLKKWEQWKFCSHKFTFCAQVRLQLVATSAEHLRVVRRTVCNSKKWQKLKLPLDDPPY